MDRTALFRQIWQSVFGDSDDFLALLVSQLSATRYMHLITTSDQATALSHLLRLPYLLRDGDSVVRTSYICGVATHPEARGRGLAQQLMRTAHQQLWREGYSYAVLIPATDDLRTFYRQMGYSSLLGKRYFSAMLSAEVTPTPPHTEHFARFHHWQRGIARYYPTILHTPLQWRALIESLTLERGGIYEKEQEDVYFYRTAEGVPIPLLTIPHHIGEEGKGERERENFDLETPYAMIRPIRLLSWLRSLQISDRWHPERLMPIAHRSRGGFSFDLDDTQIPTQRGRYYLPLKRSERILFQPLPSESLHHPLSVDRLFDALQPHPVGLLYGMME